MKTERQYTWDEIKVGEVFAWAGCWHIMYKDKGDHPIVLAYDKFGGDYEGDRFGPRGESFGEEDSLFPYYKLPKSVQALWKEE